MENQEGLSDAQPDTSMFEMPTPATINYVLHQGVQAVEIGDFKAAKAHFRSVYHVQRDNETALLWLGYLSENSSEAIGYYQKLLRIRPGHREAGQLLEEALAKSYLETSPLFNDDKKKQQIQYDDNGFPKPATCFPWLGELFVEKGIITKNQLSMALERQIAFAYNNKWKPLGETLLQLGFIKRFELEDALEEQQKKRNYNQDKNAVLY